MADEFLWEGQQELPVDGDYVVWRQAQQRRLSLARQRWLQILVEAGVTGWGKGSRSLAYLRPDLLAEYDGERNENVVDPAFEVSVRSVQSVWWRCLRDDSHRWRTSMNNRHVRGTGCPRCGKRGVSRREQEVFEALRKRLPGLASPGTAARHVTSGRAVRRLRSWRVDMLLSGSPPVAVEYDGAYWHQDALQRDQDKTADLIASGHLVIRIREEPLSAITSHDVICTPDQPAGEVAEQVYQRILGLTDPAAHGPGKESASTGGEQLDLFDDSTCAGTAGGISDAFVPLRALMGSWLQETHRRDVEWDLALAQHLMCDGPLHVLIAQVNREVGGAQAFASMARRLADGM
ncbi:zinc-ribbon domain-containing protein [Streptomyces lydicus]|uniref:zinc-ribbon domain-containing protein n=1 Tax=Streptomyces lydicus TaxID=47763 RepID=UPI003674D74C